MTRGKFITIEGQDGAGKTTNAAVIKDYLETASIPFVHSREPGGTALGESVRDLILNSDDEKIGDKAELLLMFAARAQHIQDVIEPALARGDWVLCDRFTDATYAYQGGGRGMPMKHISELEHYVQGCLRPDLTVLLDLPVALGEMRAGQRSDPDRFEQQQLNFKQGVRDCYLARASAEPNRIKVVDASQSIDAVSGAIGAIMEVFVAND
ncbi:MAG: dTMP kinase [Arenicella sp.]|nr:dTMP kinase [Arenicella sp.]